MGTYDALKRAGKSDEARSRAQQAVDGARVRALRETLSWSQMELAYRAGITQAKLSNIENNAARAGIRADTLKAMCVALGCSADYLLGLSDNPATR